VTDTLSTKRTAELRHELRTPVNHILGYSELLAEDVEAGSSQAESLAAIGVAAREVLRLINALLPPTGTTRPDALQSLFAQLRAPQARILLATGSLLNDAPNPDFAADVQKIAKAAQQLLSAPIAGDRTHPAEPPSVRPPARAAATPGGTPAVTAQKGRILVVDDVEENRAVLARRLAREGYTVENAAGGEEALRLVASGSFDLVLLDVMMPDLDGFAVLERIKADPATRSLPVIMISALDDLASVVRCIEHGAEDYLAKPFDQVLLRARIGASLEKKRWHDREADYLRQVTRVIDAAGAVEKGTYAAGALGAITSRDDELGRLARVFDSMAAGVRARESKLREQLLQLRTDITLATSEYSATPAARDADTDALAPGAKLAGRYEIRAIIGRGGMGVVYRAHDRELLEEVAIKTIRRDLLSDDPVLDEQLKSEIRLARRISHRNVVRTHDLGEADGITFVTMEYVQGLTVRELLDTRGRLGVSSTLALARQFTEALAVAHDAGVIHRDVKPENALVDAEGVLKVMDFGIARFAAATSSRTQSGMIVGTPAYMAPEQLVDDEVDARADLYALGVVLYECLTGIPPFEANSVVSLIAKVLSTEPLPPSERHADVPPAVSALVMRLLTKTPDGRPASAHKLLELLTELG
jgi:CheY-like chemotaxis protein/tRNA A-37 threonylcarbamoyl transferase component Bud32